jgi:hypothetical protein
MASIRTSLQWVFGSAFVLVAFNDLAAQIKVKDAIGQIQQTVASGSPCAVPSTVYKTDKDQASQKHGVPIPPDAIQNKILSQLALGADVSQSVTIYDGFVTKLMDTPSADTTFGAHDASELLGISTSTTDPAQLLEWGNGSAILKLDCTSLMNDALDVSAGSGTFLPIISLNGTFSGTQKSQASTNVTIVAGTASAPFAKYYYQPTGDYKQLLASLRGLIWLTSPLATTSKRVMYLKSAKIISFTQNINQSAANSLAASITAGASIPLYLSAKGSVGYQLTNDFALSASRFTTYYYSPEVVNFPPKSELLSKVQSDLPAFSYSTPSILPGDSVTMQSSVKGFPHDLCKPNGVWDITLTNADKYDLSTVSVAIGDDTSDAFPVCNIALTAKSNGTVAAGEGPPQFRLAYHIDTSVYFDVKGDSVFTVLQSPSFSPTEGALGLTVVQNSPSAGTPVSQVVWKINGIAQVPSSYVIDHYTLDASPLSCKLADNTEVPLRGSFATTYNPAPSYFDSPNLTLPYTSQNITILGGLTLGGAVDYNANAPKSAMKTCTLTGKMHLFVKPAAGGALQDKPATFTIAGLSFPPQRGTPTIGLFSCPGTQPGQPVHLASLDASGLACDIGGSDLDLRNLASFRLSNAVALATKLTPGKDSGHATISISLSDLKKLTNPLPYSLWLSDELGNENNSGASLTVVPFPQLQGSVSLAQIKANPTIQLLGTNLAQVQGVYLLDHTSHQRIVTGTVTANNDTSLQVSMTASDVSHLTANAYDLALLVDKTSGATYDPGFEIQ